MSDKKLQIKKYTLRGEDNHKTFSIRIEKDLLSKIEDISRQTGRSRNELINVLLEFAVDNCEIID
ncbi:MAG: ribbon-helix-helix domain-containing protein [Oscillospiraceae bacterium]|nr:ribbon-helix-helix domain-containing protein [Oscillospiraceae bacterium]